MINTKKVLLTLFILLIPTVSVLTFVYLRNKEGESVKGVSQKEKECTPYVTNMMPNSVKVGDVYYFSPRIVGCDAKDVEISVDGADWLSVGEGKYIFGTPTGFDLGIHRVMLIVSSNGNSSKYTEYILVE